MNIDSLPGFSNSVEVAEVTPQEIYAWLEVLDEQAFRDWHPDHRAFKVRRRTPGLVGSRMYFKEVIAGFRISGSWDLVYADPPQTMLFRKVFWPVYWRLSLKATPAGTLVINDQRYGLGIAWFDRIWGWLLETFILTRSVREAINRHDREEFRQLGERLRTRRGTAAAAAP